MLMTESGSGSPVVDLVPWCKRIEEAGQRIYELAIQTPVTRVDDGRFGSAAVYLKREDLQRTGSFKLRGATNKVLSLPPQIAAKGVVTSSTGNHGLGVATAARQRGVAAEVFVSSQVSSKKLLALEQLSARIRQVGETSLEAELAARAAARDSGRTYISPYNDAEVIAGQGTIASELLTQLRQVDVIYVAVGGGGLISGIGAYVKQVSPATEVVGCWPENSRVMYECLGAGEIIEYAEQPTLSESTAGGVEPGSLTFALCRRVIDRSVLVSEADILEAMRWAHGHGWPLEGAAGVAIAACSKDGGRLSDKIAVIIACGANTSPEVLRLI